jgi:hypothetical protein
LSISTLGVYSHFFAGFMVVAQWLSLKLLDGCAGAKAEFRKGWRQIATAIVPLVVFVASTGVGVLRWIPRPGRLSLYITSIYLTGGGGDKLLWLYFAAVLAALLPAIPPLIGRRRLAVEQWRYWFLFIWLFFPIAAVFLISQWKPCFLARYFIFTLPALALLTAAGIARLRWPVLMGMAMLVFGAWSMPAVRLGYSKDIDIVREDFRSATSYVLANAQPGDALLFYQPIGRMPYEYYRSLSGSKAFPKVVFPAYGNQLTFRDFYAGRPPEPFLASLPAQYRRVWILFTHNQVFGGPDPTTAFISQAYGKQFGAVQLAHFQEIELRLYSRGNVTSSTSSMLYGVTR